MPIHASPSTFTQYDCKPNCKPKIIQHILAHPKIWRASYLANKHTREKPSHEMIPTEYAELDQHLNGGWPLGQLTELSYGAMGIGELLLILPALAQISTQKK
jgi:protein ImuA